VEMYKLGSIAIVSIGLVLGACSKKSSDDAASSSVNEFSSLAEVTGPVSGSAASSLALQNKLETFAAVTGISLSSPGTFSSGTSLQLCENVNYVKEILREAASPDKILCYMSKMKANNVIPNSLELADGSAKYIKLVNLPSGGGGGGGSPVVKFEIVKSGSSIASFKMWSCFSSSGGSPVQSEYISETFSDLSATVISKYKGSESGASYGSSMTASGSFSNGSWNSKNITGYRYYSNSGNSNVMTLNMDQYSDRLNMSIAMKGRYGSGTYKNKFYSVAQLIGNSLANFAIGDGSTKADMSYDSDSNGSAEFSNTSVVSWNGDSKANLSTASSGTYYSLANAGSVPAEPDTTQTVTFSGAESWDCSLPAGSSWIEADFNSGGTGITEGMQACEDKYLGNGGGWISCPY
jgi:hypothetical protein